MTARAGAGAGVGVRRGAGRRRGRRGVAPRPPFGRAGAVYAGLLLLVAALVLAHGCGRGAGVARITPDALAARLASGEAPLVLDVRSVGEFEAGHVPGATNIPVDALTARLDELPADRDTEIVVHCKSGVRAKRAEAALLEAGYTNVVDLDGHIEAWRRGGHPLE